MKNIFEKDYVCSLINGGHREISMFRNKRGFVVEWRHRHISESFLFRDYSSPMMAFLEASYFLKACIAEYRKLYGDCYVIR